MDSSNYASLLQFDKVMPYEAAMAKDNMWAQFYQVRFPLFATEHLQSIMMVLCLGSRTRALG